MGVASTAGVVGACDFETVASDTTGFIGFAAGGATTAGTAATTRRSVGGRATGGATATGGRAMTGPTGGLLAMAGPGAGATMFAPWRGRGTMRRGAAGVAWAGAAEETGTAAGGAAITRGGTAATEAGGGATTAVGRGGGAALAVASACLRSRIAFRASPGLDTLERSNFGLVSAVDRFAPLLLPPFLK